MRRNVLRAVVLLTLLLLAPSCSKLLEPLYVYLPGTEWVYELDGKRALIHFDQDGSASVLQKTIDGGAVQQNNGTYVSDGHSTVITGNDGTTFKLIRTFTNLKNSKNKNMDRYTPKHYEHLSHTVWAAVNQSDLFVYYFPDDAQLVRANFTVTQYVEGVPFGWTKVTKPYSLTGYYTFTAGTEVGWLFPDAMFSEGCWHAAYPIPEGSGTSQMEGTLWYSRTGTSTSAGILIFNTGYSFVRLQVVGSSQFYYEQGTYTLDGNTLTMTLNGKTDNCTISSDNRFAFMERSYAKMD